MASELLAQARSGSARAVGRLLTLAESGALRESLPSTGAQVIGITGPPGVGKSTTTSALTGLLRAAGRRVAVLAVDPSSPLSGGALLGDRVRMGDHDTDTGVFIRSMASRGHLGGLAAAAPAAVRVLDACGWEVVLVETVGVGQSEVEVASAADTTVVVLAPGAGDAVQAAKAGVLEVADVFCVNKADRPGAAATARDLQAAVARGAGSWQVPVVTASAAQGEGVAELAAAIAQHHLWLTETGELARRRSARAAAEVQAVALAMLRQRLVVPDEVARAVRAGEVDPWTAAEQLLA